MYLLTFCLYYKLLNILVQLSDGKVQFFSNIREEVKRGGGGILCFCKGFKFLSSISDKRDDLFLFFPDVDILTTVWALKIFTY